MDIQKKLEELKKNREQAAFQLNYQLGAIDGQIALLEEMLKDEPAKEPNVER
jgi:hypothetical protein